MGNTPAVLDYRNLLADIGQLYEVARRTVAETYWKIGQRLVEVEQDGAERAKYGGKLLERLSGDLSAKYGRGFSVDNLERMRQLYLAYPKSPAPVKLAWTQYVELLPILDKKVRKRLENRAEAEGLSSRDLRKLAQKEVAGPAPRSSPLRRPAGLKLHTYRLADAPGIRVPAGKMLVDCGFLVYRALATEDRSGSARLARKRVRVRWAEGKPSAIADLTPPATLARSACGQVALVPLADPPRSGTRRLDKRESTRQQPRAR